ncbi:NUMOD1 domain-containing DNA-binding protein [Aestuariivivens insulae]|uniref:NUMOD1 domain-containing DNA-binding protein n=1 Tax=Aestuariivivens insulae TaxID=1621988 RepID=UPI001F583D2F|nr:NUMOD1 domain-containing DNA-binding protein [Aestuariivivens insulae]
MSKHILYLVENKENGKVYVGATSSTVEKRRLDHERRSTSNRLNQFQEAIRTYGPEAFNWQQIDTVYSIDELAQKEKLYILEFNAKEDGYNEDCGGGFKKSVYQYSLNDGSLISRYDCLDDASKAINSTKQHISRACLNVNKIYGGYYWSYEFKKPFAPEIDSRRKEVCQYSLGGQLLASYESASEASRQSGVSKTCITRCCRGEREKSGGFKWTYR